MFGALDLSQQPAQDYLGPSGAIRYFENARGYRICQYFWPAHGLVKPRGIICLLHGHGTYLGFQFLRLETACVLPVYEGSWVQSLNNAGFAVCGVDNQGSGRSEGLRAYLRSFDDLVEDVVTHAGLICSYGLPSFSPDVPRFVMGSSMGGCLALVTCNAHPALFQGCILLAAMLSLDKLASKPLNRMLAPFGMLISALVPKLPVAASAKNTLYPELQKQYESDPNNWTQKTRARNAMEYLRVTGLLMRSGGMEASTVPMLIFHGLCDDMCDIDGSKALYLRSSSQDKELHLVEDTWHVLTREPSNVHTLATVIQWCCKRGLATPEPAPAPTPAASAAAASGLRVTAQALSNLPVASQPRTATLAASDADVEVQSGRRVDSGPP